MKSFNRVTAFDGSEIAKFRIEAIEFYEKYGLEATLAAFKISKANLYRWRKCYLDSGKRLASLIPHSTKPKRLRQRYAPKPTSFGHIEMDTLVKFVDGMKIYLITAIDIKLKFSFAQAYTSLSSHNALDCFKKLEFIYPFPLHTVQTDNGLEFLKEFDNHLKKRKIKHLLPYPRCPKINGVVERFNRTIRRYFLEPNLHLIHQPQLFHRKLMDYLLFFNTKRPHQSLGQRSPLSYALEEGYLSQMYWTSTKY